MIRKITIPSHEPPPGTVIDPIAWAALGQLLGEHGQAMIRELTLIEENELKLEAIAGPEATPALIAQARREHGRLVDATARTVDPSPRLSTVLLSYVLTVARGEQP